MKRCAFLTLDATGEFVIDDELAYPALRLAGWSVTEVPWRSRHVTWDAYDAVVIRSPWDYQADADGFLSVLGEIERSSARLFNGIELVRWNMHKTYLRDLSRRGIPIVPTCWREGLRQGDLERLFHEVGADEIVVKPVLSANADGAFRLTRETLPKQRREVEQYYAGRALMAQPFLPTVQEEGEFSLVYFCGHYSHAILKTPSPGDFRVQEEHGGYVRGCQLEAGLRAAGDAVLQAVAGDPLYARVDLVRSPDTDTFWLMELELIEPSLYFRMDPESPRRFAQALDQHWQQSRAEEGRATRVD